MDHSPKPAKWWKFWSPDESGGVGGIIAAAVFLGLLAAAHWLKR